MLNIEVQKYLNDTLKLHSYIIANGQHVGHNLFNEPVFTLRSQSAKVEHQRVAYITRINGRPDIAVLEKPLDDPINGEIRSFMVQFPLEIKTVEQLSAPDSCKSQVIIELIGLNIANERKSPPVLLTNLVGSHFVYYLELTSAADEPVSYRICRMKCSTFLDAVLFASRKAKEVGISFDFSRPKSPLEAILEEKLNFNDD